MWSRATGRDRCTASHLTCAGKIKAIEFRMLMMMMMIDSEQKKKKKITKTIRSLLAHPVFIPHNLPLKLLKTVRVEFKILHFCMELAFLCVCGCFKKKKKKKLKMPKNFPLTTVANSSAQKEKGRNTARKKKRSIAFEKKKKSNTTQSPALVPPVPSFPKAHCSAMRFLKSPTCALHMLLPGANETKLSYATPFRNKRMCEHKASPLQRWYGPWVTCDEVGGYVHHVISRDEWQPSALSLWFDTFFSQQTSVSDEWLRMALTFHCFGLTCTVCIAMQAFPRPFTQNWSYCRALRTTWMFLLVLFVFHSFTHKHGTYSNR